MFWESFKANILILVFFSLIIFLGYWGVVSLEKNSKKIVSNKEDVYPIVVNDPLGYKEEVSEQDEASSDSSSLGQDGSISEEYVQLKEGLQKLVSDKILMKSGSKGTRVGIVQEFLNIYFDTSSVVDNDYGPGTETRIKNFQKENNLISDGQAGPDTYKKMIEWLEKN